MKGLFDTLQLLMQLGSMLAFAFMVLLAMPQSKLRDVVMPFVGWAVAALSAAYVVLPFDLVPEAFLGPFGLIDDLIAGVIAIFSAITAWAASKRLGATMQLESSKPVEPAVINTPSRVIEIFDVENVEPGSRAQVEA